MHMKFAGLAKIVSDQGKLSAEIDRLVLNDTKDFTHILGAVTNYQLSHLNFNDAINTMDSVKAMVQKVVSTHYTIIVENHVSVHQNFYNRVKLDISNVKQDIIPADKRLLAMKQGYSDPYMVQVLFHVPQ